MRNLDHLLAQARYLARTSVEVRIGSWPGPKLAALQRELENEFERFQKTRHFLGDIRDGSRKSATGRFFRTWERFQAEASRALGESSPVQAAPLRRKIKTALAFFKGIPMGIRGLALPEKGTPFDVDPRGLDLTRSINRIYRSHAEATDASVQVVGMENIPELPSNTSERTVRVFMPTHRSAQPWLDSVLMAHIAPDDSLIFMKTRQVMPLWLAKIAERSPSIISVGPFGWDPVKHAIQRLDRGLSRNLWIYPEGTTPAGVEETLPIRKKFASALLPRLEAAGYRLQLIPITYTESSRLMNVPVGFAEPVSLRAVIHPALGPGELAALRLGGEQAVSHQLRSIWMDTLPTNSTHLLGTARAAHVRTTILNQAGCLNEGLALELGR